jgi:hypothetical protein
MQLAVGVDLHAFHVDPEHLVWGCCRDFDRTCPIPRNVFKPEAVKRTNRDYCNQQHKGEGKAALPSPNHEV